MATRVPKPDTNYLILEIGVHSSWKAHRCVGKDPCVENVVPFASQEWNDANLE